MAITTGTMTDEQRKSVTLEYLKAFDNGGVTSDGGSILDLFADDAQAYFPKWGLASGKAEIGQLFGDVGGMVNSITHDYATFNYIFSGSDLLVVEGTSSASTGTVRGGPVSPTGPRAGGATSSRFGTSRYSAALSTWTPTTPAPTRSGTPGSRKQPTSEGKAVIAVMPEFGTREESQA